MNRLIQDDSCHWYVIAVSEVTEFEKWIEYHGDDQTYEIPWNGKNFDNCRVDGPHRIKFMEWREE